MSTDQMSTLGNQINSNESSDNRPLIRWSGPSDDQAEIFGFEGEPQYWRRTSARPMLTMPFIAGSEICQHPTLGMTIDDEAVGEHYFLVRVISGPARLARFIRIDVPGPGVFATAGTGVTLPIGAATIWAVFQPNATEVRISKPRNAVVRKEVSERMVSIARQGQRIALDLSDVVMPGTVQYRELEVEFMHNIERLTYDDNRALRLEEIQNRRITLLSAPPQLQILLGHRCNADCIMCEDGRKPDLATVPAPLLEQMPKLMRFAHSLTLIGGEPLLFKSIKGILQEANKHPDLVVNFATNGALLLDGWMDVILSGRYGINISIDAINRETYGHIRRKLDWDKLNLTLDTMARERNGHWPDVRLSFCVMRSNYRQIPEYVDFAYRKGASLVRFNTLIGGPLEPENVGELFENDENVCREVVAMIREARRRADALGIDFVEKVLGWLLPRYPHLVTHEDEIAILRSADRNTARAALADNKANDDAYWTARGGRPSYPPLPLPGERPDIPEDLGGNYRPYPSLASIAPKGFFCSVPFSRLTFTPENTVVCCHAHRPFNGINYSEVKSLFDVWNHPLMQYARRQMYLQDAGEHVCHPRCPFVRKNGVKA